MPQVPSITTIASVQDAQTWLDHVSDAMVHAYLTGDAWPAMAVAAPDGAECSRELATVCDLHQQGWWSEAPEVSYRVRSMEKVGFDPDAVRDGDGNELREIPALHPDAGAVDVSLTRTGNRWLVEPVPVPDSHGAG